MLSYGDAARAGAHGTGHAFAAGGRWAPEAEIGVLKADMKSDPSQRFDDFPGEQPSRGEVQHWARKARAKMNEDQKAVMRGTVSAKLMSETTPFVVNTIPSLPASDRLNDCVARRDSRQPRGE